jgi:Ser/Thr protein kinase RdoA (MazF antagonist)
MEQSRIIPIDILSQFDIPGSIVTIEELKRGHINRTYVAVWEGAGHRKRYVHQVVNHRVFQDIEGLMHNLDVVTSTLREMKASGRLRSDEVTLTLIKARSGARFLQDEAGEYWRTFEFIEDTVSYDVCPSPAVAAEAAAILGRFQRSLIELDPKSFAETIPHFLDGGRRYDAFRQAIAENPKSRVTECQSEIEFALQRAEFGGSLMQALKEGFLPCRVTHNDTKLNNVLFDRRGSRAICLLDLDTCMAGTVLFDFGDLVRNTAVPCAEDEQDVSKVRFDMELYRAICSGYLAEVGDLLTPAEKARLATAPRNLALILGVRFLTDYLLGDTYFRIHRAQHNLERARTQFQIVRMLEQLEDQMRQVAEDAG